MLEVIERFPAIGTIADYQALPSGEKELYNEYVIAKIKEEAQPIRTISINKPKK
jgi:hypothetical protein